MGIVAVDAKSVRATPNATVSWQAAMKTAIRDAAVLCERLQLPASFAEAAREAAAGFPLFAPLGYVDKMERGNPDDPLLKQVLPVASERDRVPGFATDAVGDLAATARPGLLHKYHGRALLIVTGACAVHCRYCFRRHFPYAESPRTLEAWRPALGHLAADTSIEEVILSGGDPLTLPDARLKSLIAELDRIPHLQRVRIHSRLPIVLPQRLTSGLLAMLQETRLAAIMVVHANHPNEVQGDVVNALRQLVRAGFLTLNQAVLLRGVNDNVEALFQLSRRLVNVGVMPYYLHQLDRVAGTAHFEVPIEHGRELLRSLQARLPGYAVPRYVQEVAGESHKTTLV